MNLCNFCTHLTFDLIMSLGGIFRLGIHPSVFPYMPRNTFSMDAKMYSKMPTELFSFCSSDWQLCTTLFVTVIIKLRLFQAVEQYIVYQYRSM